MVEDGNIVLHAAWVREAGVSLVRTRKNPLQQDSRNNGTLVSGSESSRVVCIATTSESRTFLITDLVNNSLETSV